MGAGIGAIAAASAGSNLLGGVLSYQSQQDQLDLQRHENELNRKFNAEQAEISRDWSTNERVAQQVYNTGEREAAQAYNTQERLATQEYNSPVNQVKRLRAAGINPAVYFSGSGPSMATSSPQSSGGASSGMPSAATASFGNGINPVPLQIPQLMTGAADMIKAFTDANVGEHSISLIDANVEKALSEVYTNQQIAEAKRLENELNRSNLPRNIRKSILELGKLSAEIGLIKSEESKNDVQKELIELQQKTEKEIAKLKGQEAITASIYANKASRLFESQIKANEGSAALSNEKVNTEKTQQQLNISQSSLNGFKSDIAEIQRNFDTATFETRLKSAINKLSESEYDALLKRLQAKDFNAYTTLQRILLGKRQDGDKIRDLFNILHDIDKTTALPNAKVGK